jgi:dienelactone hydrolase
MFLHRAALVAGALVAALVLARGGTSQPTCQAHPSWTLSPSSGWIDVRPITYQVSGLCQGTPTDTYTITLTSTDAHNVLWQSSAKYQVIRKIQSDGTGTIDLWMDKPTSGTYPTEIDPAGLFDSMVPSNPSNPPDPKYWYYRWPHGPQPFTFTVTGGDLPSAGFSATITRKAWWPGTFERGPAHGFGFYGEYFRPPVPRGEALHTHAAVLIFGGSEGGLNPLVTLPARLLAAKGFAVLALEYFKPQLGNPGMQTAQSDPSFPPTLANIPLSYFAGALQWLSLRPIVDPNRLFVWGTSRGSEAALLLASLYPTFVQGGLVHGVIASVPEADVGCSQFDTNTPPNCVVQSWTGTGLTYPAPIPVQKITGNVFLVCDGNDYVWSTTGFNNCSLGPNADALGQILNTLSPMVRAQAKVEKCLACGHGVGLLVPYDPIFQQPSPPSSSPPSSSLPCMSTGTPACPNGINPNGTNANWKNRYKDSLIWQPDLLNFLNS